MSRERQREIADARLTRALDSLAKLVRALDPIEQFTSSTLRTAAREAKALLAELGR